MNNIAAVKGEAKWGVLLDAENKAIRFGEIIDRKDDMIIFEGFGPYPMRLVLQYASALSAQEIFDSIVENAKREEAVCGYF